MKCDWNLIFKVLNQAKSVFDSAGFYETSVLDESIFSRVKSYNTRVNPFETNEPIMFSQVTLLGDRNLESDVEWNQFYIIFNVIYTHIQFIQKFGLADVQPLGYRTAIIIDSITSKGSSYLDKVKILKAVEQGQSTEKSIAKKLKFKKHTVNYYLQQFEQNDFIEGARGYPLAGAGPLEYHTYILNSKGKVALDNHNLLLEEVAMQNNINNFNAPVGSVGNQGTQTNVTGINQGTQIGTQYNSPQQKTLVESAEEIQKLLKQLEQDNPSATEDQQIEHLDDETTPKFKRKAVAALKAATDTAIDEIFDNSYVKVGKAAIMGWIDS